MTSPIRVLELRSVWGTGGGPDKTILASARRANPDVALTVCYLRSARDAVFPIGEQARDLGHDYVELHERFSLDPSIWPALRALVRDRRIDIVHAHEYKTDVLTYLLAKREPVIPLATAHGWTGHLVREWAVYYQIDKRLLRRFPKLIAVSGEIKRTLVSYGADPNRVQVVLNGIDPNKFRRDAAARQPARDALAIAPGDIVVGAVGRLERQKRFDLLIEAFAAAAAHNGALRLLIAGEGSFRSALEKQIATLGLTGRCRLIGQADVVAFHHAIDIYVQSSEYEGTPNVVLEAMALESPIVATDVGGTGELMFDDVHGLLIPPGRTADIQRGIERILADPAAAARRSKAARERVETELSFDRRMATVDQIYAELIQARNAATRPR